ncbi:MAG: CHAT domain-containing protein [Stigonema ocellatum SAG 48.90 = DSM 106950]|nr:CHAT domain-containing protein [Stigonema ocellatum SAG 48.90 = DSM 106950]
MSSDSPIKILFLSADPTNASRLRLWQELRDIRERLQLAKFRDRFLLESRESVRPGDISQAIFDIEPQIVHFSGHGSNTGDLCFENVLGEIQPVSPSALAKLFELVADRISCVILNACYSEIQAEAIVKHIPFVIGMNQAIGDQAAIAFSVGFYKALGANQGIEKAYKFGCVEIQMQGISEQLTPVLYASENFGTHLEQEQTHSINDLRLREASLKYYLYVSETKINMIYPQISNQNNDGVEMLFSKVKAIHKYLEKNKIIGSLGNPAAYIYGRIPMNWGCLREYASDIVFFGTQKVTDSIVLVGSKYSLVGQSKESATEHSPDYYLFKFFNTCTEDEKLFSLDNLKVSPLNDRNFRFLLGLESFNRFMSKVDHKDEPVEFLARMLKIYKQGRDQLMIATPIYVALDDEPNIK